MTNFTTADSYRLGIRLLVVLLLGGSLPLQLQARQDMDAAARLRLAQSFEQAGQWDKAVPIYEMLYEKDPQNYVFFDGLRRSYAQLKAYDKAIRLVNDRLHQTPGDVNLLSILGGLYYDAGEEKKADSLWQQVVLTDPNNVNLYRLVANQLIEHRLYDRAIKTYLTARAMTSNITLFADELASLYAALQQYAAATREFVTIVRSRPQQLSYVQARMSPMTTREDGRKALLLVVQESVRKWPTEIALHSLLAWLYMEGKEFEPALEEYRLIDHLTKSNGTEIFNFGQLALRERAYKAAAKAYKEVLERYPSELMLPQARLGYARSIEQLAIQSDSLNLSLSLVGVPSTRPSKQQEQTVSESFPSYVGAILLYESIIKDYPNTFYAAEALFRVGMIKYDRFFDLDGALAALRQVRLLGAAGTLRFDATSRIAEILLAQNHLREARAEWTLLTQLGPQQIREQSILHLAELDFYEAKFDSSLIRLHDIATNMNTDLANDALELQYFIEENKSTAAQALTEFAKADLLMRQRKYAEALSRFQDLARRSGGLLLEDDVQMRIGELFLLLNRPEESIATFRKIVDSLSSSIVRDKAQMQIGEVYEKTVRDKNRAIEAYEQVLIKFPTSLYAEEARKRIRRLRGDLI